MLIGSISRFANIAAGLPLSARPRWWTMPSSLVVRRADGAKHLGKALSEDLASAQNFIAAKAGERLSHARPYALTREGP